MFSGYTHTHGVILLVVICEYQSTPSCALIQAFHAIAIAIPAGRVTDAQNDWTRFPANLRGGFYARGVRVNARPAASVDISKPRVRIVAWAQNARSFRQCPLLAPALHRRGNVHRLAIFGDRAAGKIDTAVLQGVDDIVVGQNRFGVSCGDHRPDAVAHGFGRMTIAAFRRGDRDGEEIFELEKAARRQHVFVGGDAADGRFMHLDRIGHGLEVQRPQMIDAVAQEGILLADDFASPPS